MTSPLDTERQRSLTSVHARRVKPHSDCRASSPNVSPRRHRRTSLCLQRNARYSRPNFIVRLWRGDVPLRPGLLGLRRACRFYLAFATPNHDLWPLSLLFPTSKLQTTSLISLAACACLRRDLMTGVWRSATRYASIKPNRKIWAIWQNVPSSSA